MKLKVGGILISTAPNTWMPRNSIFIVSRVLDNDLYDLQSKGATKVVTWRGQSCLHEDLIPLKSLTKLEIALLNLNL